MRYKNVNTGAVVDVRDDKVMGSEWEAQTKSAPKKSTSKSDSSK